MRPTSDSLRETLFNVLGPTLDGVRVLDAFAGTGALGLEALSRGAARATFVERDPGALRVLRANVDACGVADACAIIRGDFPGVLERQPGGTFELILLDPPYETEDLAAVIAAAAAFAASSARVVVEHGRRRASPETAGSLRRSRVLTAGDSALSFYAPEPLPTRID